MKNLIHITLFSLISLVASFQTKLNGQCENTCNGPLRNWTNIKEKNFNFRHEFKKKNS